MAMSGPAFLWVDTAVAKAEFRELQPTVVAEIDKNRDLASGALLLRKYANFILASTKISHEEDKGKEAFLSQPRLLLSYWSNLDDLGLSTGARVASNRIRNAARLCMESRKMTTDVQTMIIEDGDYKLTRPLKTVQPMGVVDFLDETLFNADLAVQQKALVLTLRCLVFENVAITSRRHIAAFIDGRRADIQPRPCEWMARFVTDVREFLARGIPRPNWPDNRILLYILFNAWQAELGDLQQDNNDITLSHLNDNYLSVEGYTPIEALENPGPLPAMPPFNLAEMMASGADRTTRQGRNLRESLVPGAVDAGSPIGLRGMGIQHVDIRTPGATVGTQAEYPADVQVFNGFVREPPHKGYYSEIWPFSQALGNHYRELQLAVDLSVPVESLNPYQRQLRNIMTEDWKTQTLSEMAITIGLRLDTKEDNIPKDVRDHHKQCIALARLGQPPMPRSTNDVLSTYKHALEYFGHGQGAITQLLGEQSLENAPRTTFPVAFTLIPGTTRAMDAPPMMAIIDKAPTPKRSTSITSSGNASLTKEAELARVPITTPSRAGGTRGATPTPVSITTPGRVSRAMEAKPTSLRQKKLRPSTQTLGADAQKQLIEEAVKHGVFSVPSGVGQKYALKMGELHKTRTDGALAAMARRDMNIGLDLAFVTLQDPNSTGSNYMHWLGLIEEGPLQPLAQEQDKNDPRIRQKVTALIFAFFGIPNAHAAYEVDYPLYRRALGKLGYPSKSIDQMAGEGKSSIDCVKEGLYSPEGGVPQADFDRVMATRREPMLKAIHGQPAEILAWLAGALKAVKVSDVVDVSRLASVIRLTGIQSPRLAAITGKDQRGVATALLFAMFGIPANVSDHYAVDQKAYRQALGLLGYPPNKVKEMAGPGPEPDDSQSTISNHSFESPSEGLLDSPSDSSFDSPSQIGARRNDGVYTHSDSNEQRRQRGEDFWAAFNSVVSDEDGSSDALSDSQSVFLPVLRAWHDRRIVDFRTVICSESPSLQSMCTKQMFSKYPGIHGVAMLLAWGGATFPDNVCYRKGGGLVVATPELRRNALELYTAALEVLKYPRTAVAAMAIGRWPSPPPVTPTGAQLSQGGVLNTPVRSPPAPEALPPGDVERDPAQDPVVDTHSLLHAVPAPEALLQHVAPLPIAAASGALPLPVNDPIIDAPLSPVRSATPPSVPDSAVVEPLPVHAASLPIEVASGALPPPAVDPDIDTLVPPDTIVVSGADAVPVLDARAVDMRRSLHDYVNGYTCSVSVDSNGRLLYRFLAQLYETLEFATVSRFIVDAYTVFSKSDQSYSWKEAYQLCVGGVFAWAGLPLPPNQDEQTRHYYTVALNAAKPVLPQNEQLEFSDLMCMPTMTRLSHIDCNKGYRTTQFGNQELLDNLWGKRAMLHGRQVLDQAGYAHLILADASGHNPKNARIFVIGKSPTLEKTSSGDIFFVAAAYLGVPFVLIASAQTDPTAYRHALNLLNYTETQQDIMLSVNAMRLLNIRNISGFLFTGCFPDKNDAELYSAWVQSSVCLRQLLRPSTPSKNEGGGPSTPPCRVAEFRAGLIRSSGNGGDAATIRNSIIEHNKELEAILPADASEADVFCVLHAWAYLPTAQYMDKDLYRRALEILHTPDAEIEVLQQQEWKGCQILYIRKAPTEAPNEDMDAIKLAEREGERPRKPLAVEPVIDEEPVESFARTLNEVGIFDTTMEQGVATLLHLESSQNGYAMADARQASAMARCGFPWKGTEGMGYQLYIAAWKMFGFANEQPPPYVD